MQRTFWDAFSFDALTRRQTFHSAVDQSKSEPAADGLQKKLGVLDLIGYGVGCTVGAGIYSLIGPGVEVAGPALSVSFALGTLACAFTGMAYSEFASRCPVAGSAYTYAYTSFGELAAWFIGANLTLEYAISAAAIARSWADYMAALAARIAGVHQSAVPSWLFGMPLAGNGEVLSFSALAGFIVIACSLIMLLGVSESSTFNIVVTAINIAVLALVVVAGSFRADAGNWTVEEDSYAPYGAGSVVQGAGLVFFSFLGFEMCSSMAEEVKNPQRDMPIGILSSLGIAAGVYVSVTLVVTAMAPFTSLADQPAPLAWAFDHVGMVWASWVINVGSLFGLTAATFTCLLGQPRIFYRMASDGLLFPLFKNLNNKGVPLEGTLITGAFTAAIALCVSLEALADAISIGTLLAFSMVDAGVILLRYVEDPAAKRRAAEARRAVASAVRAGRSQGALGEGGEGEHQEGGGGALGDDQRRSASYSAPSRSSGSGSGSGELPGSGSGDADGKHVSLSEEVGGGRSKRQGTRLGRGLRDEGDSGSEERKYSREQEGAAVGPHVSDADAQHVQVSVQVDLDGWFGEFGAGCVVCCAAPGAPNGGVVMGQLGLFCALAFLSGLGLQLGWSIWAIWPPAVLALVVACWIACWPTPGENIPRTFVCPLVPWVPLAGMFVNMVMLAGIQADAWLRLVVWTALGMALYVLYGIHNSKLGVIAWKKKQEDLSGGVSGLGAREGDALLAAGAGAAAPGATGAGRVSLSGGLLGGAGGVDGDLVTGASPGGLSMAGMGGRSSGSSEDVPRWATTGGDEVGLQ